MPHNQPPTPQPNNHLSDHDLLMRIDERLNLVILRLEESREVLKLQDGRVASLEKARDKQEGARNFIVRALKFAAGAASVSAAVVGFYEKYVRP